MSKLIVCSYERGVELATSCICGGYSLDLRVSVTQGLAAARLYCRCGAVDMKSIDGENFVQVIHEVEPFSVSGQPNI